MSGQGHWTQSDDIRISGEDSKSCRTAVYDLWTVTQRPSTYPLPHGFLLEAKKMKSWRIPSPWLAEDWEPMPPWGSDGVTTRYRKSSSSTWWISSHFLIQEWTQREKCIEFEMNWRSPDYTVKGTVPQFEKSSHLLCCLQLGEKIEATWLFYHKYRRKLFSLLHIDISYYTISVTCVSVGTTLVVAKNRKIVQTKWNKYFSSLISELCVGYNVYPFCIQNELKSGFPTSKLRGSNCTKCLCDI